MGAMDRSSKTVLVVDDLHDIRTVYELALRHFGYNVITAASAREALHLLIVHQVDAVLTDRWMPGMNGESMAHVIRQSENLRHIPIAMISAIRMYEENVNKDVFDHLLQKPCSLDTIVDTIDQMCFAELRP